MPDGGATAIVRRAPFSENPQVGVRGQRARERILEAALQVFGELGYHPCGISQITEVAGCSRASFYQYFSSKEDVFRHLAGQVARQLEAAAEATAPITADAAGWDSLRAWIDRHGAVYTRYEPVFDAFAAAAESDEAVAGGSARIEERYVAIFRSKILGATLADGDLDPVIALLLTVTTRTPRVTEVLRTAVASTSLRTERVRGALADVYHRSLFGLDPEVNVQAPGRRVAAARLDPALRARLTDDATPSDLTPAGSRTLSSLLDAAHRVLVVRGYHGTRVDDITAAAGVSHGAFYRYFPNKDQVVRALGLRAMGRISTAFADMPAGVGDDRHVLREWLTRYGSSYAEEASMIRVWVDATAGDPMLSIESSAALDWGRQRLVRFLEHRAFRGDVDTDAMLGVVVLDSMGARPQTPDRIEAAARIVERGLFGVS
jgi:AcrR family transcriptional regulator